jgi:hypothetical protein
MFINPYHCVAGIYIFCSTTQNFFFSNLLGCMVLRYYLGVVVYIVIEATYTNDIGFAKVVPVLIGI